MATLEEACRRGNAEAIKGARGEWRRLKKRDRSGLLHSVVQSGHADAVVALLAAGAGAGSVLNSRDGTGQTALHLAAKQHNAAVTNVLLQSGANTNMRDAHRHMPLDIWLDTAGDATKGVEALLASGARVTAQALQSAIARNQSALVRQLVEGGVATTALAAASETWSALKDSPIPAAGWRCCCSLVPRDADIGDILEHAVEMVPM